MKTSKMTTRILPILGIVAVMLLASAVPVVQCAETGTTYAVYGSSITAVTTDDHRVQILNSYGDNAYNLANHDPPLEFVEGREDSRYDAFMLKEKGSSSTNVLENGGTFDVDLTIPQGYRFAVKVTLSFWIHVSEVTITINDGENTRTSTVGGLGILHSTYYLVDSSRDYTSSYSDINDNEWFTGTDKDLSINISGTQYATLELEIIFPHGDGSS